MNKMDFEEMKGAYSALVTPSTKDNRINVEMIGWLVNDENDAAAARAARRGERGDRVDAQVSPFHLWRSSRHPNTTKP
jgi:hypothetical protein